MRILLIGHGRMGLLVESLAPAYGHEIAGVITDESGDRAIADGEFGRLDMAIDFSTGAAVPTSLAQLAARGVSAVIGTTGWQASEPAMRELVAKSGIGVLAAANFAVGMNIFQLIVEQAARQFAAQGDCGVWIHEAHHATKKDAPSGSALMLKAAIERAGYGGPVDISSTRAGAILGTHSVGFNTGSEGVTLTHDVRDRAVFAHGALQAANWLRGRRGWFTMRDMLESGSSTGSKGS